MTNKVHDKATLLTKTLHVFYGGGAHKEKYAVRLLNNNV